MRNIWKKLLAGVALSSILLVPVFGVAETTVYADDEVVTATSCFTWVEVDDGVTITGLSEEGAVVTELIIPAEIDGKPVVEIGLQAFFQNTAITKVLLPDGLKRIGEDAFRGCNGLTDIEIPETVESLGSFAFGYSGLTSITIPASVTSMGRGVVSTCHNLSVVVVDENNSNYCAENGIIYNKDKTLLHSITNVYEDSTYVMPNTILEVGEFAFVNNRIITDVTLSENLQTIQSDAFFHCGVKGLAIPSRVSYIALKSLETHNLEEFTVDENNPFYKAVNGMLLTKDGTTVVGQMVNKGLTEITVPEGVRTILTNCELSWIEGLTKITLPSTLLDIPSSFGSWCSSLTTVVIPEGVVVIGRNAFSECDALKEVVIPASVKNIGLGAFGNCDNLILKIYTGSYAENYAKENNIAYELISDDTPSVDASLNGVVLGSDGLWAYYVNGVVDTTFTGLATNESGTWYIENGYLNWEFTDLFSWTDGWYYIMDGRVPTEYTGLVRNGAGLWYVESGKINQEYTNLVSSAEGWFYVMDGRVTEEYTGLVRNDAGLWYVAGGKLDETHTDLVSSMEGWFYVMNGRVTEEYTGLVRNSEGLWYVANGKLDDTYTNLVSSVEGWFYAMNGRVTEEYTGLVANENGNWYVDRGAVSLTHEGLICDDTGWWYVIESHVATDYTGLAANDAGTWYVQNGYLDFAFSGEVTIGDETYTVVGGMVQ